MSSPSEPRTCTARWVFPVAGPPLPNGTVTVRGERVESVDAAGVRAPDEDFGNAAIIPGLVNAHTHLDLSGARGLIPPTDPDHFTDWLRGVIAYRRTRTLEQVQADIRAGLAECLRTGTTLLGDITADGASWDAVAGVSLRAVVFLELIGLTSERVAEQRATRIRFDVERHETRDCRKGISPHAPYSVQGPMFKTHIGWREPLTTHLAESPGEVELIESKSGPFESFLRGLGVWRPEVLVPSFLKIVRRTRHAPVVLFAHCNYLPPETPLSGNQTIVYCPRTHAAFGHPPHPFREFLGRGVRVCLGTDSLASNPDLDVLAEARFVHAKYPDVPGETLLRMVTLSGSEALGWADETGSLEPGRSADFVVVPLPDADNADPYRLLFADHPGDRRTMFRGAWRQESWS